MAKYDIKMACGHIETHQIYGPVKSRPAQEKNIGYRQCRECNTLDMLDRGASSAAKNAMDGLPILKGSPKQIAWAETLRAEALAADADFVSASMDIGSKALAAGKGTQEEYDLMASQLNAGFAQVRANKTAGYWIDNRSHNGGYRVKQAIKTLQA